MLWIAGQPWQERPAESPSGRPRRADTPHSLGKKNKPQMLQSLGMLCDDIDDWQHSFISVTVFGSFGVEDVAAPLCQVGQHAENCLNAELRKAGSRLLTASTPSSVPLCQHSQHLLRYLEVATVLSYTNAKDNKIMSLYDSSPPAAPLACSRAACRAEYEVKGRL